MLARRKIGDILYGWRWCLGVGGRGLGKASNRRKYSSFVHCTHTMSDRPPKGKRMINLFLMQILRQFESRFSQIQQLGARTKAVHEFLIVFYFIRRLSSAFAHQNEQRRQPVLWIWIALSFVLIINKRTHFHTGHQPSLRRRLCALAKCIWVSGNEWVYREYRP